MFSDFSSINRLSGYILEGVKYTLELTIITAVGGLILGTGLALCRLSTSPLPLGLFQALHQPDARRAPRTRALLVLSADARSSQSAVQAGSPRHDRRGDDRIITFVLFEAAYFAEIMRAGIQSVSRGQMFAAKALGLRYAQTMRYVILPQAVRNMLPVLLTQTIILFQDTSLVYVISGNDFMGAVSKIAQRDGELVLMYSFAAVCYLVVSVSLSMLVRRLQKKIAVAAR